MSDYSNNNRTSNSYTDDDLDGIEFLDVQETNDDYIYDFDKDEFIGSNGTTYNMKDIKYFIIPTAEMEKILGKSESKKLNTSKITNSSKMK